MSGVSSVSSVSGPSTSVSAPLEVKPQFPAMFEIEQDPIERIHALWKANNEALLGIANNSAIPHIGFLGATAKEGVQIRDSKTNAGHCNHVIGLDCMLDPVTKVADWTTAVDEVLLRQSDPSGVIFVLETSKAKCLRKYIWLDPSQRKRPVKGDTEKDFYFLDLVYRKETDDAPAWYQLSLPAQLSGTSVLWSTKHVHVVDQLELPFTAANYDAIVKKFIWVDSMGYPEARINKLLNSKENWPRGVLAARLRTQRILLEAFIALGVIKENESSPDALAKWKEDSGKWLLDDAKRVATVLSDVFKEHRHSQVPFKLVSGRRDPIV